MRRVIFPVAPEPSQALLGYLEKVAQANFYLDIGWLIDGAEIFRSPCNGRPRVLREVVFGQVPLRTVEELCGAPLGSLERLTYPLVDGDATMCRFGANHLPIAQLAPLRRRRCPTCELAGIPPSRLFDLSLYTVCHVHGCWLVSDCAKCGRTFRHTQPVSDQCLSCEHPISRESETASADALEVAVEIASLDQGSPSREGAAYSCLAQFLHGILSAALLTVPESAMGRFKLTLHAQSDLELRSIVERAWSWMRDRERFAAELSSHLAERRAALPSSSDEMWRLHIDRAASDARCPVMQQLSQWATSVATPAPIPTSDDRAAEIQRERINLRTAARALGTSVIAIRALITRGILAEGKHGTKEFSAENSFEAREIDALFARLRAASCPETSTWAKSAITLQDASNLRVSIHAIGVAGVLHGILDGRFRATLGPAAGFGGLLVNRDDLAAPIDVAVSDHLTLKEAAAEMGTPRSALYGFLKSGFLEGKVVTLRGRKHRVVPRAEVERFKSGYVLGNTLAKRFNVHHALFVERLLFAGAVPACGPSPKCQAAYVFSVEVLSNNFVERALSDPLFEPRRPLAGRPKTRASAFDGLWPARVAATRLGISSAMLSKLLSRGLLRIHKPVGVRTNRKFFKPAEVEEYERQYRLNPALVTLSEAEKLLGLTSAEFRRIYLLRGTLTIVEDGAGGRFVSRAKVEALQSKSAEFITGRSAREEFGLTRTQFRNLSKTFAPHKPEHLSGRWLLYSRESIRKALVEASQNVVRLRG